MQWSNANSWWMSITFYTVEEANLPSKSVMQQSFNTVCVYQGKMACQESDSDLKSTIVSYAWRIIFTLEWLFMTALMVFRFSNIAIRSLRWGGGRYPSETIRSNKRKAVESVVRKCSDCARFGVTIWSELNFLSQINIYAAYPELRNWYRE